MAKKAPINIKQANQTLPRSYVDSHNKKLFTNHRAYYLPADDLHYASVILDMALDIDHPRTTREQFLDVITAMTLPDCQAIISRAGLSTAKRFAGLLVQSVSNDSRLPPLPIVIEQTYNEYLDNSDFLRWEESVRRLVLHGFNHRQAIKDKKPLVVAEKAPYLVGAIAYRAWLELNRLDFEEQRRWRPIIFKGKEYDLNDIMESTQDHRIKRIFTTNKGDWELRKDDKTIQDARWWYMARVVYGNISVAATRACLDYTGMEHYPYEGTVNNRIRRCDVALGIRT